MDPKAEVMQAAKAAAKALGTQEAVAKATGHRKSAVTYWMRGENCSLETYFKLLDIAKRPRTPAAIVLGAFIAASALIYTKPSDASDSEKQTAAKPSAAVYYVKYCLETISRLLSGFAALPALRAS